jgi:hypothetical protein
VLAAAGHLDPPRGRVVVVVVDSKEVLHAAYEVDGVAADEEGVLAGRLAGAAPPRVAHHVDVGAPVRELRVSQVVHGAHLGGHRTPNTAPQRLVERRRAVEHEREAGGAGVGLAGVGRSDRLAVVPGETIQGKVTGPKEKLGRKRD